ncbi:hypothetical protein SNE40_005227 [Patella caerulea]|uniref:G-protein coupled receptors family 1 profile domain-containing protein n=1 Tax=Patella caerulea TaxID=87958 RepID=A0AAN8PZR7_PATCE
MERTPETFQPTSIPIDVIRDISNVTKSMLVFLYSVIITVSLVGNSLVFLTFICNRHMRSIVNVFIVSLAISDFTVTITCMPINLGNILTKYWIFGAFSCKLVPFIDNLTVSSSSLTLCCIAFDRYYAIVHPLKANAVKTPKRAAILLLIVWIIALVSSIPYSFCFELFEVCIDPKGCPKHKAHRTAHFCRGQDRSQIDQLQIWLTMVVLFIIPFVFMTVTYSVICYTLWSKRPIGSSFGQSEDVQTRYKKKAVKMLILVVLLFVGCWSPLIIFEVVAKETELLASDKSLTSKYYLQWLALSSACVNPIIFAFMNEKFRKNFNKILCCRRNQIDPLPKRTTQPINLTLMDTGNNSNPDSQRVKSESVMKESTQV